MNSYWKLQKEMKQLWERSDEMLTALVATYSDSPSTKDILHGPDILKLLT